MYNVNKSPLNSLTAYLVLNQVCRHRWFHSMGKSCQHSIFVHLDVCLIISLNMSNQLIEQCSVREPSQGKSCLDSICVHLNIV